MWLLFIRCCRSEWRKTKFAYNTMKTIPRATGICAVAILTILAANGQPETNPPTQQAAPPREAVRSREVLAGGVIGGIASGKADPAAKLEPGLKKALAEFNVAMKGLLVTLTGVQDKASADAAAPVLKKHGDVVSRVSALFASQEDPAVMDLLESRQEEVLRINEQIARIQAKGYYGSKALSDLIEGGEDEEDEERTGESTPGSGPETGKPEVAPGKVESRPASDNF